MSNFFQNACKSQGIGSKIMVNMMNSGHEKWQSKHCLYAKKVSAGNGKGN